MRETAITLPRVPDRKRVGKGATPNTALLTNEVSLIPTVRGRERVSLRTQWAVVFLRKRPSRGDMEAEEEGPGVTQAQTGNWTQCLGSGGERKGERTI